MVILQPLVSSFDQLEDSVACYPSIEDARPAQCPGCGQAARPPGRPLGIVGHGSYRRQVLGGGLRTASGIRVRRFLCRGCGGTISVQPDLLHPRRWYGAWAILEVLVLYLAGHRSLKQIEYGARGLVSQGGWSSPRRWAGELLSRLWPWRARELGVKNDRQRDPPPRTRLDRLLGLVGEAAVPGAGARAAPLLGSGTAHTLGASWTLGQTAPEAYRREARRQ